MLNNEAIDKKVFELESLEMQVKELKEAIETIKDELKGELDKRQEDCIDTGFNRVWYKLVAKNNLDTKKAKEFIAENANLKDFIKETVEPRFTITHKTTV